jgi:hypothetical protein
VLIFPEVVNTLNTSLSKNVDEWKPPTIRIGDEHAHEAVIDATGSLLSLFQSVVPWLS